MNDVVRLHYRDLYVIIYQWKTSLSRMKGRYKRMIYRKKIDVKGCRVKHRNTEKAPMKQYDLQESTPMYHVLNSDGLGEMQQKLKKYLSEEKFQHSLGVMYTAAALAMRYQTDLEQALIAGLLHDCAKSMPNYKKIELCQKQKIPISKAEQASPFLLHAKLGVLLARKKYHIEDEEILSAIRYHTTGRSEMTLLEKIIYVADYIEPWRHKAKNLSTIRTLAFQDIDAVLVVILKNTLEYLKKSGIVVDDMTLKAYDYYKQKI